MNLHNMAVIHNMPTTTNELQAQSYLTLGNTHESCFRSYHILSEVKNMLKEKEKPETILLAIELMENGFK